jgi:sucrose phosphorylase
MFDAVINHVSTQSAWFQAFLRDDPAYRHFFIVVEGSPDLSQVVRPRALPLLTTFTTPSGPKNVWTTFSTDQVDLNYANPAVLLAILDLLLFYASRGAQFIRLDAIAYLWKQIGTPCIHLPQTHRVIQLIRAVLDEAAPQVLLITETNVPHRENISYFGDGTGEAQLVYNFALPPLVLHSLRTGSAATLSRWAAGIDLPPTGATFFNFLASHDGIGLNPARGILSDAEIDALVSGTLERGGLVSYKSNPDGSRSPYELNVNYFDALSDPSGSEPEHLQVDRFLAAHAIMLALVGVPGIYFHSLFGSRGWREGAERTGRNRTINRQKLLVDDLERELDDPVSLRSQVFTRFARMLAARAAAPAFHPSGTQQVLDLGDTVFGLARSAPGASQQVFCLHNLTSQIQSVNLDEFPLALSPGLARMARPKGRKKGGRGDSSFLDLLTARLYPLSHPLILEPYQVLWLTPG